jgi:hypothetical protein
VHLAVINAAKLVSGAHATTILVNEYVNARLGNYGPAVAEVWVTLVYPPRGPARPGDSFDAAIRKRAARCPRVTFFRAKRHVDVSAVCRGVSGTRIGGDGHLTRAETECVTETVSEALELIRPRVRPADGFDADAFIADAQAALAGCPAALRRYLEK